MKNLCEKKLPRRHGRLGLQLIIKQLENIYLGRNQGRTKTQKIPYIFRIEFQSQK